MRLIQFKNYLSLKVKLIILIIKIFQEIQKVWTAPNPVGI